MKLRYDIFWRFFPIEHSLLSSPDAARNGCHAGQAGAESLGCSPTGALLRRNELHFFFVGFATRKRMRFGVLNAESQALVTEVRKEVKRLQEELEAAKVHHRAAARHFLVR